MGKTGRRPRRRTPMPRTAFTAFVEQHVFLMLVGKGELSPGVQEVVSKVTKDEYYPDYVKKMERARQLVDTARKELSTHLIDEEVSQDEILRYIKEHYLFDALQE